MKRPWIKLLLFLIPALAGALFVFWRFSPEQAVIRRADALFASIEKKTIDTGTPSEKARRFEILLHPDFLVEAPQPMPSGPVPPATAASFVEDLQESIVSCRISREQQTVAFPDSDLAIYQATIEANVTITRGSQRILRYRCRFEFARSGRDWLLRSVVLTPI